MEKLGGMQPTAFEHLRVGDVVVVRKNQWLPADVVLLSTSGAEGVAYVETMNLDGETNLKIKKAPDETAHVRLDNLERFRATLECDPPDSSLYTFTGNLTLPAAGAGRAATATATATAATVIPLSPVQVLLRGSSLRNTDWAIGCVVYAGHDTKVRRRKENLGRSLSCGGYRPGG